MIERGDIIQQKTFDLNGWFLVRRARSHFTKVTKAM